MLSAVRLHAIDSHDAQSELVHILFNQEKYMQAIDVLHTMIAANPHNLKLYFELGYACTLIGNVDEGIAAYQHILKRLPHHTQALYNLGYIYKMCGRCDEAIACYKRLIADHPDYDNAYFALSRAYLRKGDFAAGWQAAERHFKKSGTYAEDVRSLVRTGTLRGKTIALVPEGGLGDTVQCIRYAHVLKNHGATIIAAVQKELIPLLSRCTYIDTLISSDDELPAHDAHATLMSMPAIMHDDEQTLPTPIPYINANPELVAAWAATLAHDTRIRVGICWQASSAHDASRPPVARRGIPLKYFFALADMPTISLYSLQKYDGMEQCADAPTTRIIFNDNLDTLHGPFMDTAAIICNLDLVITVDTAIAHIAGALGKSVWLLLPFEADWRWLANRTDSPWYPTMHIFQQPHPFDWDSVMHEVTTALQEHFT